MFQFRRFPAYAYLIQRRLTDHESAGLPHSEISGSMRMCRSPKLIAACHVLHRLLMPRHSPCALYSLTYRSVFTKRARKAIWFSSSKSNYAGIRVDKIVLVLPFIQKVPQKFMFPSVACSSYFWLLCSVFKVRISDLKSDSSTQRLPNT